MRVAAVDPASRAAAAGVRAGDVILAVNHVPAGDQTSFDRGAEKARQSGSVLLLVQRGDVELYLAFDAGGR